MTLDDGKGIEVNPLRCTSTNGSSPAARSPVVASLPALLALIIRLGAQTSPADAAVTPYTDEAAFLADTAALGYCLVI